jgi:hypothetical protein
MNAGWNPTLPLTGGTLTGNLVISSAAANPALILTGPTGFNRQINGQTLGSNRWRMDLGNSVAESGGNVGSNFAITAFSDAGVAVGTPLVIERSTGYMNLCALGATPFAPGAAATIHSVIRMNKATGGINYIIGQSNASNRWVMSLGSGAAESGSNAGSDFLIQNYSDTAALLGTPLSISRATGNVTIGTTTPTLIIDGPAGSNRFLQYNTSGALRWYAYVTGGAESGGNVGSDYAINRYSDAGAFLAQGLVINRANGTVTIPGSLNVTGTSTLNGSVAMNALSCSTINTNGNTITAGPVNAGAMTCTTLVAATNVQVNNGANAAWYYVIGGNNQWNFGASTDGNFYFQDTGAGSRFYITTAGNCVVVNSLTVSGTFLTNGITCTTINTQGNVITTGGMNASGTINANIVAAAANVQVNSNAEAQLYLTCNGVRQWYIGSHPSNFFRIVDGSGGVERLRIDTAGTVTVFQTLVAGNFQSTGTSNCGSNGVTYALTGNTFAFNWASNYLVVWHNGVNRGTINITASDERLKRNVKAIECDPLAQIRQLKLISYDMPDLDTHVSAGFSAQQIGTVIPDALIKSVRVPYDEERDLETDPYGEEELLYSFDTNAIIARLVGAVQQLTARLETLEGTHHAQR